MNILETKHLTKRFGGLVAVNEVSLHVEAGEIVGLIGPNGAGKTTLLNAMAGLNPPDIRRGLFSGKESDRAAAGEHVPFRAFANLSDPPPVS